MDVLLWVLFGLLPAIAAMLLGVGLGGARWLGIALAVAVCTPLLMSDGWPGWVWDLDWMNAPPRAALWWTLILGGVIGSASDARILPKPIALLLELALVWMLPWLLSAPLRARWSFEGYILYLFVGCLMTALIWLGLRKVAKNFSGLTVPAVMTAVLGVDAWVLRNHAGGADWQLAGVASVALGFAVVTTAWRRPFHCGTGAALCMTLAHTGLLFCGHTDRELLHLPFLLAWVAPLPMWILALPYSREHRRVAAAIGMMSTIACGGLAAWLSGPGSVS